MCDEIVGRELACRRRRCQLAGGTHPSSCIVPGSTLVGAIVGYHALDGMNYSTHTSGRVRTRIICESDFHCWRPTGARKYINYSTYIDREAGMTLEMISRLVDTWKIIRQAQTYTRTQEERRMDACTHAHAHPPNQEIANQRVCLAICVCQACERAHTLDTGRKLSQCHRLID